jgi:zinc transport system substrate-binding protein
MIALNGGSAEVDWARIGIVSVTFIAGLGACSGPGPTSAGEDVTADRRYDVFVSILPQAYLVERVGGERVNVHVLVLPGQSPEIYSPTPQQISALSRARLYFRVGVPFENALVSKVRDVMGNLEIVDTREGIELRVMESDHAHDEVHPHSDGFDPHIWLSPVSVKQQASTMAAALARVDPMHAAEYDRNLAHFLGDVDATTARIRANLAPFKGRSFYVFHPAYGYFADAFGLRQVAVEAEGKRPTPKHLQELIGQVKAEGVRTIFVQPQFDRDSAEAIADAVGGTVEPLDPLARDILRNLEEMAAKIEAALIRDDVSNPGR